MKHLLNVGLAALAAITAMAVITRVSKTPVSAAEHNLSLSQQLDPTKPMQRGVSVQLPVSSHAAAMPEADELDALVVTLTKDGKVYVGERQVSPADLSGQIKADVSNRAGKTLHIKADARIPYAELVNVLDSVRPAGVKTLTLLTYQRDSEAPGTILPPKGFELMIVTPQQ
jgi:biopolymer transport protein TolR